LANDINAEIVNKQDEVAMDLRILYRVILRPTMVFKDFSDKTRFEPLIFIGMLSIIASVIAYVNHLEDVIKEPWLFLIGLFQGVLLLLLFPLLSTILVLLAARSVLRTTVGFITLLNIFILAELPYYIETLLIVFAGYSPISIGSLLGSFGDTPPLLSGFLLSITPFFVWIVVLWWIAVTNLLKLTHRQTITLVGALVLLNILAGGIWNFIAA
jgi:hypothetical protein